EELFPSEKAIGQTILLNKEHWLVIGVIKKRTPGGGVGDGQLGEDFDRDVYIPIKTRRVRFGERVIIGQGDSRTAEQVELHQITLTVSDIDKVLNTGKIVRELLESHHPKRDWEVQVPLEKVEAAERKLNAPGK